MTLVAETGGQNAWVVDSSALLEQVMQDVLISAFDSAGHPRISLDGALHHGDAASRQAVLQTLAERSGPILTLTALNLGERRIPLERLWTERSLSINTAAAGSNASLMTLKDV